MSITNLRKSLANRRLRLPVCFLLLVVIPAVLPCALSAQTFPNPPQSPPVPFIQSVSPASATPGQTTSGQQGLQLTIIGTGFVPSPGLTSAPASVLNSVYSGAAGTVVPLTTSCTSSTSCTAILPQALQGTYILTMMNPLPVPTPNPPPPPGAFLSNPVLFTVAPTSPTAFANFPSNSAGIAPVAITTGDFNEDGLTDLAVVNSGDNTVTILLSKGDGTFMDSAGNPCGFESATAPFIPSPNSCPTYSTGHNPVAITVGKLNTNNDSHLDLVIANQNDNDLTVLLGDGTGKFTTKANPCGASPCSSLVGVAPFALGVAGAPATTINAAAPSGGMSGTPGTSATILFVLNQHDSNCPPATNGSPTNPSLTGLLSQNDGSFINLLTKVPSGAIGPSGHVCLDSQFNPSAMVLGDFNNDGYVDIAISARGIPQTSSAIANVPACATGSGTVNLIDGQALVNGLLNLVLAVQPLNEFIMNSFCAGPSPGSIAAGEFSDGNLDLVVSNTGGATVSVLKNTCSSSNNCPALPSSPFSTPRFSFGNPVSYPAGTLSPTSVTVGDFNSDGFLDIAVADQSGSLVSVVQNNLPAFIACVLLNCTNFPPAFASPIVAPTQDAKGVGQGPAALVALDINGDGKLDIATANNHDNSVSLLVQGVSLTIACASGTGTGPTPPECLGTPPTLNFGNVPVSTPPTKIGPLTVTVTNNGSATVSLTSGVGNSNMNPLSSDAADFPLDTTNTTCAPNLMLSPAGTCNIAVDMTPTTLGPLSAAVQIAFNSGPLTIAQSFTVSGIGVAPAVQFIPPSFAFGQQLAGTPSLAQTITLQNVGNPSDPAAAFTVSQVCLQQIPTKIIPITIPDPNFQLVGQNANGCLTPGTVLSGGGGFPFQVQFTPQSGGSFTDQLQITLTFMGVSFPQTYTLSGQGIAPIVSLSGAQLTFANQQVGTTSSVETVTLTNLGIGSNQFPADLTISGISVSNTDFQIVQVPVTQLPSGLNNCPSSGVLVVGASCVVGITFTPGFVPSPGQTARSATLLFADNNNAKSGSTQPVVLTGTATFPVVNLSTNSMALGGVPVTTKGAPMSFTLANVGSAPLSLYSIADSDSAEFIETDNCPRVPTPPTIPTASQQLAANTFCTITVVFAPSKPAGPRNATLTFTDDNFGSYNTTSLTQVVNLSGTGTDFTLSVLPTSITISPSKTATYTITLNPIDGFNNSVSFTCAGGPPHSNCFISGMSNGSASVILSTSQGVNHGTFMLTFTATYTAAPPASGTLLHSVPASLTIK